MAAPSALALLWLSGLNAVRAGPAQVAADGYLPNVASSGQRMASALEGRPAAVSGAARAQGMVGWGESIVELQSLASRHIRADLVMRSTSGFADVRAAAGLRAGGSSALALRDQTAITHSNYALVMSAEGPTAILGRSAWQGGAEAVYEAPVPDRRVVLPLTARDVYSHTTVLWLQNTAVSSRNEVLIEAFQDSGSLLNSWTVTLEPGETGPLDLFYELNFASLPVNAASGYLGSFRLSADAPIAVMAYGDEPQGRGAAAVSARPASAASTVQYLPFVRATTSEGDSLIAIASLSNQPVEVTIAYRSMADSPGGAGQSYEQSFTIAPRSQAFVDLDRRLRRGNRPVPDLPNWGFVGSAVVRASGPVLATVLDQTFTAEIDPNYGGRVVSSSYAYNGLGADDLSQTFAVPRARYLDAAYATRLALQNPNDVPVAVDVSLRDDAGREIGSRGRVTLPAGGAATFPVTLPGPGTAQVLLSSSAPVAAIALDTSSLTDWTAYAPVRMPAILIDVPTPPPPPTPTITPVPPTATPTPTVGPTPTLGWTVVATIYLPFSLD